MPGFRPLWLGLLLAALLVGSAAAQEQEQETETVFDGGTNVSFAWGTGLKVDAIQGETGTLWDFYAGVLIGGSTIIAVDGALNLSHDKTNYGYLGVLGQYAFSPKKAVHFSAQLLIASGSAKDYEREKTSLFDNYGNISGARFYLIEPSVNVELNLTTKLIAVLGLGYRYAGGLDEDSEYIQKSGLTNEDLSGLTGMIGLKFATY